MRALDQKAQAVDDNKRFTVDWYGFMVQIAAGINLPPTSVGRLPDPTQAVGARGFVTDATATTFYSIVLGGGTNGVPVVSDGTNWRIG